MKNFTWILFCVFFAVHGWAANIKMVSYFPVPYASYADLKVNNTCDLGLLNACQLDTVGLSVETKSGTVPNAALNTGTVFVKRGNFAIYSNVNSVIKGNTLYVGDVGTSNNARLEVGGNLMANGTFLSGRVVESLSAVDYAEIKSLLLKTTNGWQKFPVCEEADNEISWANLTINGVQGVYLTCGAGKEYTCEENPDQQKCCAFSKTENSITYWNGAKCETKTCASNEHLYSACGIDNVTQENLLDKRCDLSCIKYQYRWKSVGTEKIVGLRTEDFKDCPLEPYYQMGNNRVPYEEPSKCASTVVDGRSCTKGTKTCYKGAFEMEKTDGATCTYYYHDSFSCQCEEQGKCD